MLDQSTAAETSHAPRILIYSHDTFGLGHLRRSRAIANGLLAANRLASVVIVSGSPVVGNFDFAHGVDYVRLPGVVKLSQGDYTTLSLNLALDETVAMRRAILAATAEAFDPHLIIVDKEPTGFRGEIMPTLEAARRRGARIVLGVRDVMDAPEVLAPEWERKGAVQALAAFYDDIWVYGLREIYEPLAALPLPQRLVDRISYTGYLRREVPQQPSSARYPRLVRQPFLLVTTGGGGDGRELIDWVLAAYEAAPVLPLPALVVFGPFLAQEERQVFQRRIARLPQVEALTFDAGLEHLMAASAGVVSMGGYNTFCEILSFDKPALIVPRKVPRLEQTIRAEQAGRLGLVRHLDGADFDPGARRDPQVMAEALRGLSEQPLPSRAFLPGILDGLPRIERLASEWLTGFGSPPRLAGAAG